MFLHVRNATTTSLPPIQPSPTNSQQWRVCPTSPALIFLLNPPLKAMESATHGMNAGGLNIECPTAVMHDQCDPATWYKDPAFPRGPSYDRYLDTNLEKLKFCAIQGCDTCATLYAGVRGVRRDISQSPTSFKDNIVKVCAWLSVSETAF